jgi:hypothetical protein
MKGKRMTEHQSNDQVKEQSVNAIKEILQDAIDDKLDAIAVTGIMKDGSTRFATSIGTCSKLHVLGAIEILKSQLAARIKLGSPDDADA